MRVFTGSKLYDVRHTLGVSFSRHVLAKTATMQRINFQPHAVKFGKIIKLLLKM